VRNSIFDQHGNSAMRSAVLTSTAGMQ